MEMKYFKSDCHLALMSNTDQLGQSGGSRGKRSLYLLMKAAALKLVGLSLFVAGLEALTLLTPF